MTSEQPPRDALRPYRPLPSVDFPLLRGERSAVRNRRVTRAVLLVLLIAALSGGAFTLQVFDDASAPAATATIGAAPQDDAVEAARASADSAPRTAKAVVPAPPGIEGEPPPPHPPQEPARSAPPPGHALDAVDPTLEPPPQLPPTHHASVSRKQSLFGHAISFKEALEKSAGLSPTEANEAIAALTGTLDFRRSQPTDQLFVERDADGGLTRFEYRSGLTQRYEAVRKADGTLDGRQVEVPVTVKRSARGGIVRGSLGDALEGLGLGRSLAGLFTETFEGKVNFSTDSRIGDTFRIVLDELHVEGQFLRYGDVHALEYRGERAGALQAFWYAPEDDEDGDFYDADGRAMHGGWLRTPLRYDHISSGFGMRLHPVLKRKLLHNGVDYAASSGTPVRAAATGTVQFAAPKGANGNLITLSHPHGYQTFYAHLLRFASGLKKGAKVRQREVIGYVGSTGRSTGPHLHFSLKKHGTFIDPLSQLNGPGLMMPSGQLRPYKRHVRKLQAELAAIVPEEPRSVTPAASSPDGADLGEEEL